MNVQRWQAAAVPWWVTKVGLVGGWIVAFYFAASGSDVPCTAARPCVPDPLFSLAVVPLLATPLLLLFGRVLTGCAMGVAFGVLDLVLDGGATVADAWPAPPPGTLAVMARLKERFNPARIFRPGAYVGGI